MIASLVVMALHYGVAIAQGVRAPYKLRWDRVTLFLRYFLGNRWVRPRWIRWQCSNLMKTNKIHVTGTRNFLEVGLILWHLPRVWWSKGRINPAHLDEGSDHDSQSVDILQSPVSQIIWRLYIHKFFVELSHRGDIRTKTSEGARSFNNQRFDTLESTMNVKEIGKYPPQTVRL